MTDTNVDVVDSDEESLMLTTIDNPFSPKTEYERWKRFDNDNHYNTEEYIARLIIMEEVYDVEDEFALNMATTKVIQDILLNDDEGFYRLV